MPAAKSHVPNTKSAFPLTADSAAGTRGAIALSAFLFSVLQSVCSFFAALGGLRILIGLGALSSVVEAGKVWDRIHTDRIRIPMILLALAGASLNLVVLWQVRRLRARPASQWRQQPVTQRQRFSERVQIFLSWITLVLVVIEEIMHLHNFHHL